MKINFYLKDKTSKKETPIEFVIQSAYKEVDDAGKEVYKRIKRSTGLAIKPKNWNLKTKKARESYSNHQEINSRLAEIANFLLGVEKGFYEKQKP